ncbi:MAG: putative phage related protein, partial [Neobacillus sp.]|nr:putative phage related protein [Neobacillus sp.]
MSRRNISELLGSEDEMYRAMFDNQKNVLKVAVPGIIQSFDPQTQTVTVKPALRENLTKEDFSKEWQDVPLLLDVPIVIPRSGGYSLT